MLEIFILWSLCKSIGKKLRDKGRKPIGWQLLMIFSWFLFEFFGAFATAIIYHVINGPAADAGFVPYIGALGGAIFAACMVMLTVHLLPARTGPVGFPLE